MRCLSSLSIRQKLVDQVRRAKLFLQYAENEDETKDPNAFTVSVIIYLKMKP